MTTIGIGASVRLLSLWRHHLWVWGVAAGLVQGPMGSTWGPNMFWCRWCGQRLWYCHR